MGTFGGMLGSCCVAEEKKTELAERILKVLQEGGMMQLEQVKILGKETWLLQLPEYDETEMLHVWYNYFENDVWESAGYNAQDAHVWSNKIGWRHFNTVISAARVLQEFYSDSFCIAEVDGRAFCATRHIGWINYLFDESYTNARVRDPWEIHKLLPEYARSQNLLSLCECGEEECISQDGLQKYLLITRSEQVHKQIDQMEATISREPGKVSTADWINVMRRSMDAIMRDTRRTTEQKLDYLKGIMEGEIAFEDIPDANDGYRGFTIACRLLSWEVAAKYVSDEFDLDFWTLHEELKSTLAKNPRTNKTPEDSKPFLAVSPISTTMFLSCSNDDRAFWWKPGGDVVFSQEMKDWLCQLRREFDAIAADDTQIISPERFFYEMMDILHEMNCLFGDVFAFETMFREYLSHAAVREYQTSLLLLRNLFQKSKAEIDNFCEDTNAWRDKRQEVKTQLRRYLAVLANVALRKQILGF